MKKIIPFLFPIVALVLVLALAFRWYNDKATRKNGQITQFAEGQQLEEIDQAEMNRLKRPVKDLNSVELKGEGDARGEVRYELQDGKVYFSVNADLPENPDGVYQVWLKEVNGDNKRKAFVLEDSKSGFVGSAAISAETLPFEVVVSLEKKQDDMIEAILLRGVIEKQAAASATPSATPGQ